MGLFQTVLKIVYASKNIRIFDFVNSSWKSNYVLSKQNFKTSINNHINSYGNWIIATYS